MPNTYTQLFYHIVFAVKGRQSLIGPVLKDELYKYISGIITNQGQKLYIINGMPDHVHILVSCKPSIAISNLVKEIKEHSTKHVNTSGLIADKFAWQEGFGAFSVSYSGLEPVINYIKKQEEHHRQTTFREEYTRLLSELKIEYNDAYIFEEL